LNILTPWNKVFELVLAAQLIEKFMCFMEPEGSLQCSQKLTT